MNNNRKIELEIVVSSSEEIPVSELEQLQTDLYSNLEIGLTNTDAEIYLDNTRSVDPVFLGAIVLAILPVLVEKVGDLIIKWFEPHGNCSITISVPVSGSDPLTITYDPRKTSPGELKTWLKSAVESIQAE